MSNGSDRSAGHPANRIAGLAVAALGGALLLWIIPANTDSTGSGWLRPDTIPTICAWAFVLLGLVQCARPRGDLQPVGDDIVIVVAAATASVIALWAMGRVGFLPVAPVFAGVLVALFRERRPACIAGAVLGAPAVTYLVVRVLLDRPLP
ncbi:tripartite tricarboxylate transporter TctB family protein [Pseudooceanicola sp. C21-150M6]|uniref:tripartite tricarboxylate transporter TctB family protein n=1 Tax=Pseudooceanicola sp. C21-150M6 TaxID=3434355 RepID=UPI003D7F2B6F